MIDLTDFQFELLPDEDSLAGVGFGIGLDVSLNNGGFDPGAGNVSTQDVDNTSDGTTMFGVDRPLGDTWAWDLHVNRHSVADALSTLRAFRQAWRARATKLIVGQQSVIRYCLEGRTRRVYGRTQRIATPPDNLILSGYIPITCDFKASTALTFDDVEQSTTINFVVSSSGGLVFPTTFPVSPLPDGQREGGIVVGGDAPTYPIVTFVGPITNPWVQWGSVKRQFITDVPTGHSLTMDTRPWKQTILYDGQYSRPGALGRRQYMSEMTIEPGGHEVTFGGNSSEGTAQCIFAWRNAYEGF
jgi:hypothetical protein